MQENDIIIKICLIMLTGIVLGFTAKSLYTIFVDQALSAQTMQQIIGIECQNKKCKFPQF